MGEKNDAETLLQEKRAPKKAPGAQQKAGEDGKTQAKQAELMEDSQLPESLKPMPVCSLSSWETHIMSIAALCTTHVP
jgi:hypothetical protein